MWNVYVVFCALWLSSATSSSPLILTPYLKKNEVERARQLSRVTPDLGNVVSYSGYFTVNKNLTCGNHLFFWFFPAVRDWEKAPVILWLQGGPGSSSMYGLFELNGPFDSRPEGLISRNTSWNNFGNVIYIDNPVGVGFSFSTNKCYPRSISTVSEELYSALEQFFLLFPELQNNAFYLTGESFAGHYIPSLGALIDKKNSKKCVQINMKGVIMGNPNMKLACHDYGSFLYQVGLVDEALRDELYESQRKMKAHIEEKNYTAAYTDWDHIISDLILGKPDIPSQYTILTEPPDNSTYTTYLNTTEIRDQVHAGSQEFFDFSQDAFDNLIGTIPQSFAPDVEKLLNTKKYVVAFYSGNLDIICLYTSSECIMRGLKWPGRENYLNATRNNWYLNGQLVGWFKTADNLLLDILVKDAQHAAIYSKRDVTYRMMESIVSAKQGQNPLWALQTSVPSK